MGKVYKNDYGVLVKVKTGTDLTDVVTKQLKVTKPDGREMNWAATVQSPATEGILYYTTVSGDFDQAGLYKLQAYVTFAGSRFRGETAVFQIFDEFK